MVEMAHDTVRRPEIRDWVRDRRKAFEALVEERHSEEELAAGHGTVASCAGVYRVSGWLFGVFLHPTNKKYL